ncbi:MAG: amino acid ABC transporter substrate-binding protein [Deltaproteobacteria bacterium]|nr:amino acid ABC transporter substrate-binding protein [Deltaproteobacteria bacterium]
MPSRRILKVGCPLLATLLALAMIPVAFWSCGQDRPVRIGFAGSLSGRFSDLATEGLNGLQLAVDEQNQVGGIQGRRVEVLVRDIGYDSSLAAEAFIQLVDEGVVAVVGPMTSAMAPAMIAEADQLRVPILSPTVSSNALAGKDDWFLRVMSPSKAESVRLAGYAAKELNLRRLMAVVDVSNANYSLEYVDNFRAAFLETGGLEVLEQRFDTRTKPEFRTLASTVVHARPEAVLLVTGALDGAMICQHLRLGGMNGHLLSSGWAMTADFVAQAGQSGEGTLFCHPFKPMTGAHHKFLDRFRQRFGHDPGFAGAMAYESGLTILQAMKQTLEPKRIKDILLQDREYAGVQGSFRFDRYGDAQRAMFLIEVRDGILRGLEG